MAWSRFLRFWIMRIYGHPLAAHLRALLTILLEPTSLHHPISSSISLPQSYIPAYWDEKTTERLLPARIPNLFSTGSHCFLARLLGFSFSSRVSCLLIAFGWHGAWEARLYFAM